MACQITPAGNVFDMWTAFSSLRSDSQLCDLTLVSKDGQCFSAHQSLLCAHSRHLYGLLTSLENETETAYEVKPATIPLSEDGRIVAILLDYVYSRCPTLTLDNVREVIPAARRLGIDGLVSEGVQFLQPRITTTNCVDMLNFAHEFQLDRLEQICRNFIFRHFGALCRNGLQHELTLSDFLACLANDKLNIHSEEETFEAVVGWIGHDPDNRASHLPQVLQHVRLGLVQTDYFFQRIAQNQYVVKYESQCQNSLRSSWDMLFKMESTGARQMNLKETIVRPRIPTSVVFVLGGWSAGTPTASVETFDSRCDKWFCHPDIEDESPRSYHGLISLGTCMYVIGGFDGKAYFNTVRRFDAAARTWSDAAPMYSKRCYVSAVVCGDHVYACGGFDGRARLKSAEKYNPKTNQWTQIASMGSRRSDAGGASINGNVFMVGGFDGDQCLRTVEMYTPFADQWTYIQNMDSLRSGLCVVNYKKSLYAIGGFDGERRLRSVERFCPATMKWEPTANLHVPRSNYATAVMEDKIFVIGGFNGSKTISDVECFDDHVNVWGDVTDLNVNRSALRACVIDGLPNVTEYTFHGQTQEQ